MMEKKASQILNTFVQALLTLCNEIKVQCDTNLHFILVSFRGLYLCYYIISS